MIHQATINFIRQRLLNGAREDKIIRDLEAEGIPRDEIKSMLKTAKQDVAVATKIALPKRSIPKLMLVTCIWFVTIVCIILSALYVYHEFSSYMRDEDPKPFITLFNNLSF